MMGSNSRLLQLWRW